MVFTFFVMIGQFLLAYATSLNKLWLMDLARVVFGIGAENVVVVQNNYCIKWYSGSILNLAMGVVLSVSRFGSVVSLNLLSSIFDMLDESNAESENPKSEPGVLGMTVAI